MFYERKEKMKRARLLLSIGGIMVAFIVFSSSPAFSQLTSEEVIAEINATLEDKLDLTSEQRAVIQTELENQKTQRQSLSAQETAVKQSIDEELAKDVIDFDTIEDLITQLNGIRQNVLDLKVGTANNIKQVLTNEQEVVFTNIQAEHANDDDGDDDGDDGGEGDGDDDGDDDDDGDVVSLAFYSIECNLESDLPNWSHNDPGMITKDLLDGFVASTPCCSYSSGWAIQYGDQNATLHWSDYIGEAPPSEGYTTVGDTVDAQGVVKNNIDISNITQLRLRAVWKTGYYPFADSSSNHVSSEFYCHQDVNNYNNREIVDNPADGENYTCVLITKPQ
jgi:Spy/CpxP family protein refolding chaperone